jgi:hypothetical protein
MERRVSILRTSQSGRRQVHATLCSPAHARRSWPRCWRPSPPGTGQRPRGLPQLQDGAACVHTAHKPVRRSGRRQVHAMQPRSRTLFVASMLAPLRSMRSRSLCTSPEWAAAITSSSISFRASVRQQPVPTKNYSSTKVSIWGEREPIPTQFCARRERRFPEQFSIDVDENRLRCALFFPPRQRPSPLSARLR